MAFFLQAPTAPKDNEHCVNEGLIESTSPPQLAADTMNRAKRTNTTDLDNEHDGYSIPAKKKAKQIEYENEERAVDDISFIEAQALFGTSDYPSFYIEINASSSIADNPETHEEEQDDVQLIRSPGRMSFFGAAIDNNMPNDIESCQIDALVTDPHDPWFEYQSYHGD